ncbi:HAD family hydrolase [Reinekea forsetii]|nr:HAD family hydrolase [Reinekea forsetii]
MIDTVIFDLDNTLTHRNNSIAALCKKFIDQYKDKLKVIDFSSLYKLITSIDNNGYGSINNTHKKIKLSIATALLEQLDWKYDMNFEELLDYWMLEFPKSSVEMYGASEILKYLSNKGYRLGLVSNGADESRKATLESLGFTHYFEAIISSGAVGFKKPDPRIFSHAAACLNSPVERCCYIGDHFINDYEGAKKCGMNAIWLEGFYTMNQNPPESKVSSLNELKKYF